jgi:thioredoxin reductase
LSALAAARPRVCVVGAGAGGLVAARVLREIADVLVYEKEAAIGGVWRAGAPVLYAGLVTNLPKQIMAFRDTLFPPTPPGTPSFVSAAAVGEYLELYAQQHDLGGCIRLNCPVEAVRRVVRGPKDGRSAWQVRAGGSDVAEFDAVIIANGHYNLPSYAELPGAASFPNRIIHSCEYDVPAPFVAQTVLCIGARSSGTDVAREICEAGGRRTLTADRACRATEVSPDNDRLLRTPPVAELLPTGGVRFEDGHVEPTVDVVIHCVGYEYDFPFLREATVPPGPPDAAAGVPSARGGDGDVTRQSRLPLSVGGRRVAPLFEHLFHVDNPSLAFLGIPHSVVPFPFMEVQATLVARVLQGRARLPDTAARRTWLAAYEAGLPRLKDAHHLGNAQWDYCRRLLRMAGVADPDWETAISVNEAVYNHVGHKRPHFPGGADTYRALEYEVDHQRGRWCCVNDGAGGEVRREAKRASEAECECEAMASAGTTATSPSS